MEYICYEYENSQPEWESVYEGENVGVAIEESEPAFMDVMFAAGDDDEEETREEAEERLSDWGDVDPQSGGGNEPTAPGSAV